MVGNSHDGGARRGQRKAFRAARGAAREAVVVVEQLGIYRKEGENNQKGHASPVCSMNELLHECA